MVIIAPPTVIPIPMTMSARKLSNVDPELGGTQVGFARQASKAANHSPAKSRTERPIVTRMAPLQTIRELVPDG
jgi:hypothetical protein